MAVVKYTAALVMVAVRKREEGAAGADRSEGAMLAAAEEGGIRKDVGMEGCLCKGSVCGLLGQE